MKNLKHFTFWPAAIFLALTLIITLRDTNNFVETVGQLNNIVMRDFSWLYNLSAMTLVCLCAYAFFAPISKVQIGGKNSKPMLSPFKWFSVSLTTVIAMGILFWAVAEPILHYHQPPKFIGIEPQSPASMRFAMSTLFVHWTITPYSIYSLAALTFALCFHNLKMPFSIGSLLRPWLGKKCDGIGGEIIDGIALFAIIIGMSASLTTGILLISDGLLQEYGISKGPLTYGIIGGFIITIAVISAASGLYKGIQIQARINTVLYFAGAIFIFLVGPTVFILSLGVESFGVYLSEFFQRNLVTGASGNDLWPGWWTVAFFSSWFAWAPLTCLFLGKIARGYTVRQFLIVNLILPSLFGMFWFSVFGGSSLFFDINNDNMMMKAYDQQGLAALIYILFDQFPGASILSAVFIFACFITFITAADSTTDAIGGLCTKGVMSDDSKSPLWVKVFWGSAVGFIAWISASFIGVDAIKMLFNLAGFPGLLIILGSIGTFIKIVKMIKHEDGEVILEIKSDTALQKSAQTQQRPVTTNETEASKSKSTRPYAGQSGPLISTKPSPT
ncbi:MAG: BCCT transporter [Pseudomonadaceae bacterium]|nr:BCCT transporter [Pseudomonadaceae bacterium]